MLDVLCFVVSRPLFYVLRLLLSLKILPFGLSRQWKLNFQFH